MKVGSTSKTKTVTIQNKKQKGSPVLLEGETVTPPFHLGSQCIKTLAPGASCSVSVTFQPIAIGKQGGTLTIFSNSDNGAESVRLSGKGK